MKKWMIWMALAGTLGPLARGAGTSDRFLLPASVGNIVMSEESFREFAGPVGRALAEPVPAAERRLRLGMAAHLALNARDPAAALAAASALRELETDPVARAIAGLVTEAQVAAWRPGADFSRELADRIGRLPRIAEITKRLRDLRAKIAVTTREALLREADALGRRLDAAGSCDLASADEIIRLHHRLANVLPLREKMLAVLDEALADHGRG